MRNGMTCGSCLAALALVLVLQAGPVAAIEPSADDRLFREQVAPVLEARCVGCHSGRAPKAKLSLATAQGLKTGGESGPVVVPGRPEESLLLDSIVGDPPEMPKTGGRWNPPRWRGVRAWMRKGRTGRRG